MYKDLQVLHSFLHKNSYLKKVASQDRTIKFSNQIQITRKISQRDQAPQEEQELNQMLMLQLGVLKPLLKNREDK